MRGKELLFALSCALAGAAAAYAVRVLLGSWPSPVIFYSIIVIGLGAALVVVRYNRLGPYEGEFGSPKLESGLRERIIRETERAVRYGRSFTVVAVRNDSSTPVNWTSTVRNVDYAIPCRRGLTLLLLPETAPDGALILLRRATELSKVPVQAALVSCPGDGRTGDDLSTHLLRMVRQGVTPGHVAMRTHGSIQTVPISA